MGCRREIACDGIQTDHKLMSYNVSYNSEDSLNFYNSTGEKLSFVKNYENKTAPRVDSCGGFYQMECVCLEWYSIYYRDLSGMRGLGFSLSAHYNAHNELIYEIMDIQGNRLFEVFRNNHWASAEETIAFLDSLVIPDTLVGNKVVSGIIEFNNTPDSLGWNNQYEKAWLLPNVGVIKFWQDSVCWTLEGY